MKVLSLKQPYAELVVSGRKTIEIRKWKTHFRVKFLIHASQGEDKEAMSKFGFDFGKLEKGKIIGEAELIDVKEYNNKEEFDKEKEKHLASPEYGNIGFILRNAKKIDGPYMKGKLNLWNFDDKR